jgi:hypothetical protein
MQGTLRGLTSHGRIPCHVTAQLDNCIPSRIAYLPQPTFHGEREIESD